MCQFILLMNTKSSLLTFFDVESKCLRINLSFSERPGILGIAFSPRVFFNLPPCDFLYLFVSFQKFTVKIKQNLPFLLLLKSSIGNKKQRKIANYCTINQLQSKAFIFLAFFIMHKLLSYCTSGMCKT